MNDTQCSGRFPRGFPAPVDIDRENPVSRILDLIERNAPRFMAAGGLPFHEEKIHCGKPISSEDLAEIETLAKRGTPLERIAEETGFHYSTICRLTRRLRKIRNSPVKASALTL